MKKHKSTIILLMIFIIGLFLLFYPTVSDYWNSFHATQAVADYAARVADIPNDYYQKILDEAREYNKGAVGPRNLTEEERKKWSIQTADFRFD